MKKILVIMLILLASVFGYGRNIWLFAKSDFATPYKSEVIRGIGIIVSPVGVVVGYMNLGK